MPVILEPVRSSRNIRDKLLRRWDKREPPPLPRINENRGTRFLPSDACKFIARPIMNFHAARRFSNRKRDGYASPRYSSLPPRALEFGSRLIIASPDYYNARTTRVGTRLPAIRFNYDRSRESFHRRETCDTEDGWIISNPRERVDRMEPVIILPAGFELTEESSPIDRN